MKHVLLPGSVMLSLWALLVVSSQVMGVVPVDHWHPYPENPHLIPPDPVTKPPDVEFTLTYTWHDWDTAHDANHNVLHSDISWDAEGDIEINGNGCYIVGTLPGIEVTYNQPFPGSIEVKVKMKIPAGTSSGTQFTPVGTFDDEPLRSDRNDPPQSAIVTVTTQ
jgi:hypothetical protein